MPRTSKATSARATEKQTAVTKSARATTSKAREAVAKKIATKSVTETTAKVATKAVKKPVVKEPRKTVETKPVRRTKAQRDIVIEEILKKDIPVEVDIETVKDSEYVPKEFIVVLTPAGMVYQEPVPRYCSFESFCAVIASMPDVPDGQTFSFKAEVSVTDLSNCQVVTNCYDGTRKQNPFAKKFNLKNGTVTVGGNLVFIGQGKALTKAGADRIAKFVMKKVQEEEFFDI